MTFIHSFNYVGLYSRFINLFAQAYAYVTYYISLVYEFYFYASANSRHYVYRSSVRSSVRPVSVVIFRVKRYVLSGRILAANIRHVSGHC